MNEKQTAVKVLQFKQIEAVVRVAHTCADLLSSKSQSNEQYKSITHM